MKNLRVVFSVRIFITKAVPLKEKNILLQGRKSYHKIKIFGSAKVVNHVRSVMKQSALNFSNAVSVKVISMKFVGDYEEFKKMIKSSMN